MMRSLMLSSIVILGMLAGPGRAMAAKDKPAAPAAPAPPPEVAKLVDAFNGKWSVQTTMTPPKSEGIKFSETIDCHKGAQGRSAICAERFTAPGEGPTEYDYLIGFDTDTKIAHVYAVGSPGEVHDHRCKWSGEQVLQCEPLEATLGGQPIKETFSIKLDGNKLTLQGTVENKDGATSFVSTGIRSAK